MNELTTLGGSDWLSRRPEEDRARILKAVMEIYNRERLASASPNTVRAYDTDICRFFGVKSSGDVTADMILSVDYRRVYDYRSALASQRLSNNTIARRFSFLRGLYDLLSKIRLIPANPFEAKLLRLPNRKNTRIPTKPLTEDEIVRILRVPDRSTWMGRRDYCLMVFLLVFGLRRQEAARIDLQDVRRRGDGFEFTVLTKGAKSRTCELDKTTLEVLHSWLEVRGDKAGGLFLNRKNSSVSLSPKQIWVVVTKSAVAAGIQYKVKDSNGKPRNAIHPHSFRASNVTEIIEKHGLPTAQKYVDHSNPQTTLGYAEGKAVNHRKIAATFAPLVKKTLD